MSNKPDIKKSLEEAYTVQAAKALKVDIPDFQRALQFHDKVRGK